jgi:hypothetical protein
MEKIQVYLKFDKNDGYFTWCPVYIYDNIFVNLPRIRNVSVKNCGENRNTHFYFYFPPPPENNAVCEIMWKNMVEPDKPRNIHVVRRMRIACWVTEAACIVRVCIAYWFSTATVVTCKQLSVTFINPLQILYHLCLSITLVYAVTSV